MFANLTYKKKNQLLIIGAILSFFLIYNLGIKKTILAHDTYEEAQSKIVIASNAPVMVTKLEKELSQIDLKIGSQNNNVIDPAQGLLGLITDYCQSNNIVLREFPASVETEQKNLVIETNQFTVEGNFSKLINLVYILEQKKKLGKVSSVHYQFKKDQKSRELVLTATVYIQNIKRN